MLDSNLPPTTAEAVLALASRSWGPSDASTAQDSQPGSSTVEGDASDALAVLRRLHDLQRACDLRQVHDSWILRVVRDEPASVRRVVLGSLPEERRGSLARGFGVSEAEGRSGSRAHPEIVAWVRAAWKERLVGDRPVGPEDPLVIRVLTGWPSRRIARLLARIGLAKRAYLAVEGTAAAPSTSLSPRDAALCREFDRSWGVRREPLEEVARRDLGVARGETPQELALAGLFTVARLLSAVEPHRARWAMQHLPYHIARSLRPHMALNLPGVADAEALAWEARVFELALRSLSDEDDSSGTGVR